jgi:hypothetical protein
VRHHLGEKRLLAFYNNDGNFQLWIHLILALAFVPIRSIINIYEEVVLDYLDLHSEEWEEQMPLVEDFRLYIESTYVGKEARSTAGRQRSRRPPLISHDLWNKYDQAIQGQALTNNNSEAFNSAWSRSLEKQASVWAVIKAFEREESLAGNKMRESARGVNMNARPEKVARKELREQELSSLCANFENVPNKEYLKQVAQFMG